MFERVLLPTDFSAYSDKTVECIGQIPGVKEVILLHVLDATRSPARVWLSRQTLESLDASARKKLDEHRSMLESINLQVKVNVAVSEDGDIRKAILAAAADEQADLIAMGARGKGIISGFLLGSVSSGVLRDSKTNVLLTQYTSAEMMSEQNQAKYCRHILSRVLCPVDFSKPSRNMLEFVRGLKVPEVILVNVIRSAETTEELESSVKRAEAALREMEGILSGGQTGVKSYVRFGNPAIAISEIAEEMDVSLILICRVGQKDYIRDVPLGSTAADVAKLAQRPVLVRYPKITLDVVTRELEKDEFPLVEELWTGYHQQKADRKYDRIFGVFLEGTLVSVARCKQHPDGFEVDGVYTPNEFRGRGYARLAMAELVRACGDQPLYMHSTLDLVAFYAKFGFLPIPEIELPPTIRSRFEFAMGNLEGSNVLPMRRVP